MSKSCCCFEHADARTCFELRHYNCSPARENDREHLDGLEPEECCCGCHADEYDDELLREEEEKCNSERICNFCGLLDCICLD